MLLTAYKIGGTPVNELSSYAVSDLSGNPPFLLETTVSTGYQDISSIENLDTYRKSIVDSVGRKVDYERLRTEMQSIVTTTTYALLTTAEKKAALRNFVAGAGNDYADALYTNTEYKEFYELFRLRAKESRELRDDAVTSLLEDKAANTSLTLEQKQTFEDAASLLRTNYVRDGIKGKTYGNDIDGLYNWVKNDQGYASIAITSAVAALDEIQVTGDITDKLGIGGKFQITDSTGNNGFKTVTSIQYKSVTNKTTIETAEDLTDNTNDGNIWIGFKGLSFYTDTLRDDIMTIYEDGEY